MSHVHTLSSAISAAVSLSKHEKDEEVYVYVEFDSMERPHYKICMSYDYCGSDDGIQKIFVNGCGL